MKTKKVVRKISDTLNYSKKLKISSMKQNVKLLVREQNWQVLKRTMSRCLIGIHGQIVG